ncbi:mannose-1-phosphate guanylyltransferase/mannose-6-phosphate isomerase [Pseudomonas sp. R5(2019)]|uniref:mannose-1-phosphate guanylyltransferase/mannose-6-phosphate isomerase n=1 Tax=Pseudomonas sp. R5(2019) TaxID=2697566 RepID=UPI0014130A05|nr:mannose-1-phosphate guanylyltransferase/mannose-6-phosphate isomerase [Pseudomonas sp. R5(2019)]NBA93811.1 mannose-1-phosphate guanylyltransferase/mannose-6-phosphate isomerase [Pseudomonas sp. R5(2019)]
MSSLIPCIIAGGAGTRLWPVSRQSLPKPFLQLPDGQSLLQKTFARACGLGVERVLTVTQRDLLFRTLDDYRPLNASLVALDFILEPCGRNTAAAIAAAALHAQAQHGGDCQLLVLPADHLIDNLQAFAAAVEVARRLADEGWLVSFGLTPTRAETGFGYIETGQVLGEHGRQVARFVEKPDTATAQAWLQGGRHLWNSGMLCARTDSLLEQLQRHAPALLQAVRDCIEHSTSKRDARELQLELDAARFAQVPDLSFDYAVLEHSTCVAVVPCDLGWSDIGSWQAVRALTPADSNGNQCLADTLLHQVHDCYIQSPRLVAGIGLRDLIIVDTPDALLVLDASRSQDVGLIARQLKQADHPAYRLHRTVSCPWGTYTVLEEGPGFKIKRIVVRPGAALSLQKHQHRSEHWIVVSGTACVTNGEHVSVLQANESTFIQPGRLHRLSNPAGGELVMIEVQSGEYLGEDDIERFTDDYGRAGYD